MLQSVSITEALSAPWGSIEAVELLPEGAFFNEAAWIRFGVRENDLPPGVEKESLRVAVLDGGAWRILRDSRFDPASGSVSAAVRHFSLYGLVAEPGKSSSRGTSFEVNGITARTQDSVFGRLFVAPSFISFYAEPDVAGETTLTISGLPTDGEHHVYVNSHEEHYILTPFDGGEITLALTLEGPSLVWVQPQESTIIIGGGPEVDECSIYGDRAGDVCTLTMDIIGDVELRGGTLDCDGHSITQPAAYGGSGMGVLVPPNVFGAAIDDCVIGSGSGYFAYGIEAHGADTVVASDNTLIDNIIGVLFQGASNSFVSDNHVSGTSLWAVALWGTSLSNEVSGNIIDVDNDGVTIEGLVVAPASSGNRVFDNTITRGTGGILLAKTSDNTVKENDVSGVLTALSISSGAWPNDIYRNNFQGSILGVYSTVESIDLSSETYGGNWWGHSCPEPLFTPGVDGVPDSVTDNRAYGQKDAWLYGASPGCPGDGDGDGVPDASDNCPGVTNPDQANSDGLGGGDACDEAAPLPPVITSPADGSSTNELRPSFEGTAENASLVKIMECGTYVNEFGNEYEWCGQIAAGPADAGGLFHLLPENQLSGGEHVVHATATDAAGNTSARSSTVRFTIDISQPLPPEITHPYPAEIVRELPLAVQGICQPSFAIHVFDYGVPLGSTSCAAGGVFELLVNDLAAGDHEMTAVTVNPAGTPSLPSDPIQFSVQLLSAAAPISGMRGKAQVTGISDAPDPFSPIDEASNLAVGFRVSGVEGLEGGSPNQKFEARLLWVIRDQGTFLPTKFLQSAVEIPKGATSVQGTVQASWDGTNAWGAMVGIGQIFDYDVSLTVVRRYVGPGMGPRCSRGETPLFFGPGPRACVVDQVFVPAAGTIRITLPRQSLSLTSVYISGDGYENRGMALYDFDNDNVYEERVGARHVFHAAFTSEENITHARVFFNRQGDPACEGDVSIKGATVFAEVDLGGVSRRCFWWNAGYAIVEAAGVSGRTWTGLARFDFFRNEDWGYAEKRCDGVQQRIASPEGPCIGLSEKCMDGQFEDDTNCCSLNPALNGLPCDDGDPATADDRCFMGQCAGHGVSGDADEDGIPDSDDDILGDGWWLRTGMPDPSITARADEKKVGNVTEISIYSQGRPVVRYWRRVDAPQLVLSDILVDGSRQGDEIGFVAVDGVSDFIERYSWVFMENLAASSDVCVLKASPLSAPVLHSDCSGEGEIKISCGPDAPAVENMTCDVYKDWLKVRVDPPAIVWQVREDKPFQMRLRTGGTDGSRMNGITVCTDQNGPDCSDIYCSPGVDADCLAVRNVCRFGTGPCSKLDWISFDQLVVPDDCNPRCTGISKICTVGGCPGHQWCFSRTGCWSSCHRDAHTMELEKCDAIDNDCDGLTDENPDLIRFQLGPYNVNWWYRNICDDDDICTSDSCWRISFRPIRAMCWHAPAPPPPVAIPTCAEWACYSDGEGWVKEPHDERCLTSTDDSCPVCGLSGQCMCPSLDYCNVDADISVNPSGCEHDAPCEDHRKCTTFACVDYSRGAQYWCNQGINADQRKYQVDHCMYGQTRTCALAVEAQNSCCGHAYEYPLPIPPTEACNFFMRIDPIFLGPIVCAFPAEAEEDNCFPECTDPDVTCPTGSFKTVRHPYERIDVGQVYCSGYYIKSNCGTAYNDACNEADCDLISDTCVWREPRYKCDQEPRECDDGLSCTRSETCIDAEWTPYEYPVTPPPDFLGPYPRKCFNEGQGENCVAPFCTVMLNDGLPGVDNARCNELCGDFHGKGDPTQLWYGSRYYLCPALQEYNPPGASAPHSGCFMWLNDNCHNILPHELDACHTVACDEAGRYCYPEEIDCPDDDASCSYEYCDPSSGCQRILHDEWCRHLGCDTFRCDPPNAPPVPPGESWTRSGCVYDEEASQEYCREKYGDGWICNIYSLDPSHDYCEYLG